MVPFSSFLLFTSASSQDTTHKIGVGSCQKVLGSPWGYSCHSVYTPAWRELLFSPFSGPILSVPLRWVSGLRRLCRWDQKTEDNLLPRQTQALRIASPSDPGPPRTPLHAMLLHPRGETRWVPTHLQHSMAVSGFWKETEALYLRSAGTLRRGL